MAFLCVLSHFLLFEFQDLNFEFIFMFYLALIATTGSSREAV
jgi:hypothetical protein